jgi:probable HAF family extracellular repeat protein
VNDSGQVVGYSQSDAFSWTREDGMVDLGTLGGTSSYVNALNNSGQVVGRSTTAGNAEIHAAVWQVNTTPSDTTPPTSSIVLNPPRPPAKQDAYNSNVHASVSASDEAGGSGVAETRCQLDPLNPPAAFDDIPAGCAYTSPGADVTSNGRHTLYAASKDNAGNKEPPTSKSFTIHR